MGRKIGRENWAKDEDVTDCADCGVKFSLFKRRHHCRPCGQIFCYDCSNYFIEYTPLSRQDEEGYEPKMKRCCQKCASQPPSNSQDDTTEPGSSRADEINAPEESATEEPAAEEPAAEEPAEEEPAEVVEEPAVSAPAVEAPAEEEPAHKPFWELGKTRYRRSSFPRREASNESADPDLYAYLVFEGLQHGTMSIVWSKTRIESALAFGKPSKKVPAFKYSASGKWELYREIASNKQNWFVAWIMFIQTCVQFDSQIVDCGRDEVDAPIPTALWLHFKETNEVQKVVPNKPFSVEGVDVITATHRDNVVDFTGSMERTLFVQKSESAGHYLALDAIKGPLDDVSPMKSDGWK